jgi:hypothetical protein
VQVRLKRPRPNRTDVTASQLSPAEHQVQLRRAVIASTIGTAIEWYDFFLYSTVIQRLFAGLSACFHYRRRPCVTDRHLAALELPGAYESLPPVCSGPGYDVTRTQNHSNLQRPVSANPERLRNRTHARLHWQGHRRRVSLMIANSMARAAANRRVNRPSMIMIAPTVSRKNTV